VYEAFRGKAVVRSPAVWNNGCTRVNPFFNDLQKDVWSVAGDGNKIIFEPRSNSPKTHSLYDIAYDYRQRTTV